MAPLFALTAATSTPRCRPALELFADLTSRHPSDRYIQKPAPEEQTTKSTFGTVPTTVLTQRASRSQVQYTKIYENAFRYNHLYADLDIVKTFPMSLFAEIPKLGISE